MVAEPRSLDPNNRYPITWITHACGHTAPRKFIGFSAEDIKLLTACRTKQVCDECRSKGGKRG